jgi:hypothetical protein
MKTGNDVAKLFFRGEGSQRLTAKQTSWLMSFGSSKNMNGYSVTCGSFDNADVKVFWECTKIKYGSGIINYTCAKPKAAIPVKNDTLVILEAVLEAFQNADDEIDYSQLTSAEKQMITAQRKAINAEIRMNK